MFDTNDPNFLTALRQIFVTQDELKDIIEYQQRLFASLQELQKSLHTIHAHIRKLTDSHNVVREDANDLLRFKRDTNSALKTISDSYYQIRDEVNSFLAAITYMQRDMHKLPRVEDRLAHLESYTDNLVQHNPHHELGHNQ